MLLGGLAWAVRSPLQRTLRLNSPHSALTLAPSQLHPAFIADRTWYLQNMHLYPAKNWRPYDPRNFNEVAATDDPFVKVFQACDKKVTELPKVQRPK